MTKILHISDTHGQHNSLQLDLTNIDVLVHSGDESNYKSPSINHGEFNSFLNWFADLDIEKKIFVPGNHSTWIEANEKEARRLFKERDIIFLNKNEIVIDNVKFYGDAVNPLFGNWAYNIKREKLHKHWSLIPDDTDVLITHTPAYGILDVVDNRRMEFTGCKNLYKQIQKRNIKAHLFGHIHQDYWNLGVFNDGKTMYSNGAIVLDGKFELGAVRHGNIITL